MIDIPTASLGMSTIDGQDDGYARSVLISNMPDRRSHVRGTSALPMADYKSIILLRGYRYAKPHEIFQLHHRLTDHYHFHQHAAKYDTCPAPQALTNFFPSVKSGTCPTK